MSSINLDMIPVCSEKMQEKQACQTQWEKFLASSASFKF